MPTLLTGSNAGLIARMQRNRVYVVCVALQMRFGYPNGNVTVLRASCVSP